MSKSIQIARELRLAKLEYEVAQAQADERKAKYEKLRYQLVSEMVLDNLPKFELDSEGDIPKYTFRLETKERWSPVIENKDLLMTKLKNEAPELFTITAPTLSKYIADIVEMNGELPDSFKNLVKKFDDTHVVVRTSKNK